LEGEKQSQFVRTAFSVRSPKDCVLRSASWKLKKQSQFIRTAYSVLRSVLWFCHSCENRNPDFYGSGFHIKCGMTTLIVLLLSVVEKTKPICSYYVLRDAYCEMGFEKTNPICRRGKSV